MSEAYEQGNSRGWSAANYAVAYERAEPETPPCDHTRAAEEALVTDPAGLADFAAGFEAGWERYMEEDFPH